MAPDSSERVNVAAVDLGSNSFHMVIARLRDEGMLLLDRLREPVRLAEDMDEKGRLAKAPRERALACLERFGERIRELPSEHVRAVGTNALRRARDAGDFLAEAQRALGHPVEVISGQEEARLIYLGVAHSSPAFRERRLVVDIGGGSTEIILGEGFEHLHAHSLFMGCITWTSQYFPGGGLDRERFREAETAARQELEPFVERLRREGWDAAIGASGTVNAIAETLAANDWAHGEISLPALKTLRRTLIEAGTIGQLALEGLKPERIPVLPGGLAILTAVFRSLGIESMRPSSGALREGVLYDLVGRIRHEDVRDRTIQGLVEQYHVNEDQAARVERTALDLLRQLQKSWGIDPETGRRLLRWASRLHEIGLSVSYTGHHRHGAYLVRNHDMPGFSRDDQNILAALLLGQRRKPSAELFAELPARLLELALPLCVILRLAVLLNRRRLDGAVPPLRATAEDKGVRLGFPAGWLVEHPLSAADLAQEERWLRILGLKLRLDG